MPERNKELRAKQSLVNLGRHLLCRRAQARCVSDKDTHIVLIVDALSYRMLWLS